MFLISSFLFVCDGGPTPSILRMTLSGRGRRSVVPKGLIYPLSIAVDIDNERIFWVDAIKYTVEMASYDGLERRIVLRYSNSFLFDVAVYKVRY